MKHTVFVRSVMGIAVAALVMLSAGTASAGGQAGSFGLGGEIELSGLGGLSVSYDAGKFHTGAFIGLDDPEGDDNTDFLLGGRFYYHIASTAMSDFGVGGSLSIASIQNPPPADNTTELFLAPGFQIRAFIASNVAFSFSAGIVIGVIDADGVEIDGDVVANGGVHYYF